MKMKKSKTPKQIEKAIQNWWKAKEETRKAKATLSAASHAFLVCAKKLSKASDALPLPLLIDEDEKFCKLHRIK
jgi:hypothetical protein